jgi:hypothetical protein
MTAYGHSNTRHLAHIWHDQCRAFRHWSRYGSYDPFAGCKRRCAYSPCNDPKLCFGVSPRMEDRALDAREARATAFNDEMTFPFALRDAQE